MDSVDSVNGVPIRLTHERWFHIIENHDDLAGYYDEVLKCVESPEAILAGHHGSLIAMKNFGRNRFLLVVYREFSPDDGFIITAYFSRKINRKRIIWRIH